MFDCKRTTLFRKHLNYGHLPEEMRRRCRPPRVLPSTFPRGINTSGGQHPPRRTCAFRSGSPKTKCMPELLNDSDTPTLSTSVNNVFWNLTSAEGRKLGIRRDRGGRGGGGFKNITNGALKNAGHFPRMFVNMV